jgi:hypothetical protein
MGDKKERNMGEKRYERNMGERKTETKIRNTWETKAEKTWGGARMEIQAQRLRGETRTEHMGGKGKGDTSTERRDTVNGKRGKTEKFKNDYRVQFLQHLHLHFQNSINRATNNYYIKLIPFCTPKKEVYG